MSKRRLPKSAIIIGAGIGSLATANLLARAGVTVTIFEQSHQAGGRAGSFSEKGFTFDTGPSWYLMPEAFEHYFQLLGEDVHDHLRLKKLSPAYKVFFTSKQPSLQIYGEASKDQVTFEHIEPGAGMALKAYLEQAQKTYNLAMRHFLYTNFNSPKAFLHTQVLANSARMTQAALTPIDAYTKSFVHDQRLRQILEYPMVFLGTSPFKAPALYSLMSHMDFTQGVYYPEGGLYTIIQSLERLAVQAGVTIHYNTPVQAILTKGKHASGVSHKTGKQEADTIISNADLHFTETQLLPREAREYPASYWKKRTASPSAILLYLGVKGSLPELTHHNLIFSQAWKQNFDDIFTTKAWPNEASMYVCKPSASDISVAPKGHENIFVLVPSPARDTYSASEIDAQADLYLDQLAIQIGVPDLRKRIVYRKMFGPNDFASSYNAWQGNALGLAHTLNQSAFFRPSNKSKKLRNLYYVGGNITPGVGLPMCLIGAENLYKRLIGNRSSQPLPAPLWPRGEES